MFGVQFILHGFLVGRREFFQVLFHHGLAVVHLLAHQLADLLALFTAQVQLAERAFAAHVFAVPRAVHGAHRAVTFRHGHGHGWQGGGEHQGDQGLAHGVSPCLIPGKFRMSSGYADQGQRQSAEGKAWVKKVFPGLTHAPGHIGITGCSNSRGCAGRRSVGGHRGADRFSCAGC